MRKLSDVLVIGDFVVIVEYTGCGDLAIALFLALESVDSGNCKNARYERCTVLICMQAQRECKLYS